MGSTFSSSENTPLANTVSVTNNKKNVTNAPANAPANTPANTPVATVANVPTENNKPAENAPATNNKTGGKRHKKRRGGMASLKAFDAVHSQPSDSVMQRATTAGGSRKRKGGLWPFTSKPNTPVQYNRAAGEAEMLKDAKKTEKKAAKKAAQNAQFGTYESTSWMGRGGKTRNNRKHSRKHNRKTNKKQRK